MGKGQKTRTQQPKWWKTIIALRKKNFLFYIICIFAVFLLGGIAHALFSGFFDACAVAVKNSSHGLLSKCCDVIFVKAAKTDATELMYMPSIVIQLVVVIVPFVLVDMVKNAIHRMEEILSQTKDIDGRIERMKNSEKAAQSVEGKLDDLSLKNKNTKAEVKDALRLMRKTLFNGRLIAVVFAILFVSDLTCNVLSRSLLREYQWRVTVVRPFISDLEYQMLNRQWALMRGRDDYRSVVDQLDGYAKRETQKSDAR